MCVFEQGLESVSCMGMRVMGDQKEDERKMPVCAEHYDAGL